MILPLMLTLYLGGVEVSQGVAIDRKVTLTARTVADLVSQVSSINNAGMNAILKATAAVLTPYPTDNGEGHGVRAQDRRQQQGDGRVERHEQRHGARARARRVTRSGGADRAQYVAGLGRGVVRLTSR